MNTHHRALTGTLIAGALFFFSACAGTRTVQIGALPNNEPLLTLVVSQDLDVIRAECSGVQVPGRVLGCQKARDIILPSGRSVKVMKVARYADTLPSALNFDIAAQQLCRAVAALQPIDDPCRTKSATARQSQVTP
jgi:hypothetical protein